MKALCWQGKEKVEVKNVRDPKILNPGGVPDCSGFRTGTAAMRAVRPSFSAYLTQRQIHS